MTYMKLKRNNHLGKYLFFYFFLIFLFYECFFNFRFVTQIKDQLSLVEMESTKFECQLAPVGDPNMKVEWFLNGKPLRHSMIN